MREFLAMGGYAVFVWSAYGLATAVLIINVVMARRRLQAALRHLRQRATRQAKRHRSGREPGEGNDKGV